MRHILGDIARVACCAAVLVAWSTPAGAQAYPPTRGALEVSAARADVGEAVDVRCRGCAPSADVTFAVEGAVAGGTVAADGGEFAGTVAFADDTTGDVEVTATCPTGAGDTLVLAAALSVGATRLPLDDTDAAMFVWAALATLAVATAIVVRARRRAHV